MWCASVRHYGNFISLNHIMGSIIAVILSGMMSLGCPTTNGLAIITGIMTIFRMQTTCVMILKRGCCL